MRPGSKVICIDDQFNDEAKKKLSQFPKKGEGYIVREIIYDPLGMVPPGITLQGIYNPKQWISCRNGSVLTERHFRANRFRVTEKKNQSWDSHRLQLKKPLANPVFKN